MAKPKMTPRKWRRLEEHRQRKEAARAEINRQNAQSSTGPKTEEGKAASSRNAVRHGLSGAFCILPNEDRAAFELLLTSLLDDHKPANTTEELLVSDMARHYWLTQRALRLQDDVFTRLDLNDPAAQKQLALYIRYQTTHQRAFHKALADLQKAQKVRRQKVLDDIGFVSKIEKMRRDHYAEIATDTSETTPETPEVTSETPEWEQVTTS